MRPGRALVGAKGLDVSRRVETLAVGAAATETAARTVDGVLAGPLPDALGRALSDHRVIERIVDEALARIDVERALTQALEDERIERLRIELTERVLASPELEQIVARVLSSPQVRDALTQTSATFAQETVAGVRRRSALADAAVERMPQRWFGRPAPREARTEARAGGASYAGFATRAAAFTLDLAVVAITFLLGAAFAALITSLVGHLRPVWLVDLFAGIAWLLLTASYFVGFWSSTGQTLGMRLLGVRMVDASGAPPGAFRSLVRLFALAIAIIPCFLGLLPMLFDDRRRGLQDFVARTVVVYSRATAAGLGAAQGRAERRGPPTVEAQERRASQPHPPSEATRLS